MGKIQGQSVSDDPQPLTMAYVDLDNFKAVNDTMGHAEGDRVLQQVARKLRTNVRKTDVEARLGGDEFCALLPETGEEAIQRADRLMYQVKRSGKNAILQEVVADRGARSRRTGHRGSPSAAKVRKWVIFGPG